MRGQRTDQAAGGALAARGENEVSAAGGPVCQTSTQKRVRITGSDDARAMAKVAIRGVGVRATMRLATASAGPAFTATSAVAALNADPAARSSGPPSGETACAAITASSRAKSQARPTRKRGNGGVMPLI